MDTSKRRRERRKERMGVIALLAMHVNSPRACMESLGRSHRRSPKNPGVIVLGIGVDLSGCHSWN